MKLQCDSSPLWLQAVLDNFDTFLQDHASCEKKASGMALSILSHYPDKPKIVHAMTDLALEELNHFRQVTQIIYDKGLQLTPDKKDHYVNKLNALTRNGTSFYLIDRLLIAAIVEARGHERFGLIAEALPEGQLKRFYDAITRSEGKHFELFLNLASDFISEEAMQTRLEQLLSAEADILNALPFQPALH